MDDGIRGLAVKAVDLARKWELTNDEEDELLKLLAAAWRAGVKAAGEVVRVEFKKALLQ